MTGRCESCGKTAPLREFKEWGGDGRWRYCPPCAEAQDSFDRSMSAFGCAMLEQIRTQKEETPE